LKSPVSAWLSGRCRACIVVVVAIYLHMKEARTENTQQMADSVARKQWLGLPVDGSISSSSSTFRFARKRGVSVNWHRIVEAISRSPCAGLSAHTDRPRGIVERWRSMMSHYLAARHQRQSKGESPRGTGHVALALSGGRVCVCLSLWLLLSVGSQGRNPNPAGTLIPCLTLGPVWVTGWLYGDAVGHVRAPPP
jgi:hypothetical protein